MEHNVIYNVIKKINLKKNIYISTKGKSYVQKLQGFLILRKREDRLSGGLEEAEGSGAGVGWGGSRETGRGATGLGRAWGRLAWGRLAWGLGWELDDTVTLNLLASLLLEILRSSFLLRPP